MAIARRTRCTIHAICRANPMRTALAWIVHCLL